MVLGLVFCFLSNNETIAQLPCGGGLASSRAIDAGTYVSPDGVGINSGSSGFLLPWDFGENACANSPNGNNSANVAAAADDVYFIGTGPGAPLSTTFTFDQPVSEAHIYITRFSGGFFPDDVVSITTNGTISLSATNCLQIVNGNEVEWTRTSGLGSGRVDITATNCFTQLTLNLPQGDGVAFHLGSCFVPSGCISCAATIDQTIPQSASSETANDGEVYVQGTLTAGTATEVRIRQSAPTTGTWSAWTAASQIGATDQWEHTFTGLDGAADGSIQYEVQFQDNIEGSTCRDAQNGIAVLAPSCAATIDQATPQSASSETANDGEIFVRGTLTAGTSTEVRIRQSAPTTGTWSAWVVASQIGATDQWEHTFTGLDGAADGSIQYQIQFQDTNEGNLCRDAQNGIAVLAPNCAANSGTFTAPANCTPQKDRIIVVHNADHDGTNIQDYALTNEFGYIQDIKSIPDFPSAPTGDYLIYAVNYPPGGVDNLNVRTDIDLLTGTCFNISSVMVSVCPKEICAKYKSFSRL